MATKVWANAVVLAGALALGGCALSKESAPAPAGVAARGGGEPAPPQPEQGKAADGTQGLPKTSRKVIRNAELAIEVTSPAAAETNVTTLVQRLGRYLAGLRRD